MGGKSLGLKQLAMLAGEDYLVPPAFAVPYGSFERALAASPKGVQQSFAEASSKLAAAAPPGSGNLDMVAVRQALADVRSAVSKVTLPPDMQSEIAAAVAGQGGSLEAWGAITEDSAGVMDDPGSAAAQGAGAWRALKAVWASKWTDRAFLHRRATGIPDDDLSMAVLCMGLVPADYAFVLHTESPIAGGSKDDVYGEVVVGLGETLVGNHAGRAFAFRASKSNPGDMSLLSLPSKLDVQYAPQQNVCLIARSDSNGEDLEGFAGAGVRAPHSHPSLMSQFVFLYRCVLQFHSSKRQRISAVVPAQIEKLRISRTIFWVSIRDKYHIARSTEAQPLFPFPSTTGQFSCCCVRCPALVLARSFAGVEYTTCCPCRSVREPYERADGARVCELLGGEAAVGRRVPQRARAAPRGPGQAGGGQRRVCARHRGVLLPRPSVPAAVSCSSLKFEV